MSAIPVFYSLTLTTPPTQSPFLCIHSENKNTKVCVIGYISTLKELENLENKTCSWNKITQTRRLEKAGRALR